MIPIVHGRDWHIWHNFKPPWYQEYLVGIDMNDTIIKPPWYQECMVGIDMIDMMLYQDLTCVNNDILFLK